MSEDEEPNSQEVTDEKPAKKKGGCLKVFFALAVILILAGVISILGFCYMTGKSMEEMRGTITNIFETYRPQKVAQSFYEFRDLTVQGNDGNILEVATGDQNIVLSQEDKVRAFKLDIPGIKTVSRINVPATFRYHIDLKGDWEIIQDESRLHVIAPPLVPSLPVAFDTSKLQKQNPGWTRYITGSNMPELEKTITPELEKKAKDPAQIKLFQEKAKDSIAKFLHTWLVQDGNWDYGKVEQIIVYFPGEIIDTSDKLIKPDMAIDQPVF